MGNRFMGLILAIVVGLPILPVALAQNAGRPDLSGVWQPNKRGEEWIGSVHPKLDEIPMTADAKWIFDYNKDPRNPLAGRSELSPSVTCAPVSSTWLLQRTGRPGSQWMETIQNPKRLLMIFENDHWVRQIWTDGREHPEDLDYSWMGHSIGKWDGDTLVVDTVGIHDKAWLTSAGHPLSDALRVVERFRRPNQDTLEIDVMYHDSKLYTKPWGWKAAFKLVPNGELAEKVCNESRWLYGIDESTAYPAY